MRCENCDEYDIEPLACDPTDPYCHGVDDYLKREEAGEVIPASGCPKKAVEVKVKTTPPPEGRYCIRDTIDRREICERYLYSTHRDEIFCGKPRDGKYLAIEHEKTFGRRPLKIRECLEETTKQLDPRVREDDKEGDNDERGE
ncbi:MAG: hypothetical protein OEY64_03190 [Nitrospinota bacterium]|nr:hypothetical protein [Nitrospinota bacterium]